MTHEEATATVEWQAALAQHNRWLRTVVYARLRSADEVDEVLQEVALAAVRQAAPLADPRKVAPWLYRLAVRQVLLLRRRRGRARRREAEYSERQANAQSDAPDQNPLAWLLAGERRELVRQALRELGQRDAEILLLKYTEQWSYRQLAEHLGVGEGVVQARLHRARQRLRQRLAAWNLVEVPP